MGLIDSGSTLAPSDSIKETDAVIPLSYVTDLVRGLKDPKQCGYNLGETFQIGAMRVGEKTNEVKAVYKVQATTQPSLELVSVLVETVTSLAPLIKGVSIVQRALLNDTERQSVDKLKAAFEESAAWAATPGARPTWNWRFWSFVVEIKLDADARPLN